MAESTSSSSLVRRILHQSRRGYASRFRVSELDLPPGWRREQRGRKYTVWHDDKGNFYVGLPGCVKRCDQLHERSLKSYGARSTSHRSQLVRSLYECAHVALCLAGRMHARAMRER